MKSHLSNLKVIEIAQVLAGPAVGMFFAEKGAKVIKVENPKQGGDVTRSWKLPSEDPNSNTSAYFGSINWNKEHIFLDLTDASDRQKLNELIKDADIVLTNFKDGDSKKFNLDFESIKQLNPSIILGEISAYGEKSKRLAFDLVLQAETGFMSMNGTKHSGPVKMPVAFIDMFAAHQLKEGILEALLERSMQGGAYRVQVSLYDAAIASLCNQATNYLIGNQIPKRMGSKHPNIAPYGELFKTADNRLITFAIGNDKQFKALCTYLHLQVDYPSNKERVENRLSIETKIAEKLLLLEAQTVENDLIELKVPVAIIQSLDEVFQSEKAQQLLLEDELGKRVKTAVYSIEKY